LFAALEVATGKIIATPETKVRCTTQTDS